MLLYERRSWCPTIWKLVRLYCSKSLVSRGAGYSTLLTYGLKPLLLLGILRFGKGLYCIFTILRYFLKIRAFRRSLHYGK